ncbi:Piso0_001361 [Millerozyma farinosa CBS 7064]|uniref:Piso0_001361 protein n=1 Tax=Pichia sorbitophila (strain ATCC MYA-4447 / BCRC 22081 / CBS 7064 / NBRC 10061 / NRRL Y-12695) TaxID=559304 RepID=G8YMY9_PICSO|nr:Piso0_001361 [Millerozyma farinosa CBS 7064]
MSGMGNTHNADQKDVSMVDVSNISGADEDSRAQGYAAKEGQETGRRKSTIILTDEDQMLLDKQNERQGSLERTIGTSAEGSSQHMEHSEPSPGEDTPTIDPNATVPIDIRWVQGGEKVYVTGSFTGWRKMIGLANQSDNNFLLTLGLPQGTHRFRFVVDNELRFSDYLPTATDQMGNFVNYIEVTPDLLEAHFAGQQQESENDDMVDDPVMHKRRSSSVSSGRSDSAWATLTADDDDMGGGYSRYHEDDNDTQAQNREYITHIPPIFTEPKVMEQYYMAIDKQSKNQNGQQAWLHPPHLPPHLESVILNNFNSMDKDNNSGALPIPNHVVLNHLATTSIKHNTLAVASIVRYKRKYVTQVLYAPLRQ